MSDEHTSEQNKGSNENADHKKEEGKTSQPAEGGVSTGNDKKEGRKCVLLPLLKSSLGLSIVALVVLVVAVAAFYYDNKSKVESSATMAKEKIETFVQENAPQGSEVGELIEENGVYKSMVSVAGQEVPVYITKDGAKLFLQTIDLDETKAEGEADENGEQPAASPTQTKESTEAEVKNDKPVVDLFVMSYCPYGIQMERGLIPVVERLGDKIDYNLRFVDYSLHGQKEVDENIVQYCVQKESPAKLNQYLACFWKDSTGKTDDCLKYVGINKAKVDTCVTAFNAEYAPTTQSMGVDKALNTQFGVKGSPTLVVNGTVVSSGRDSASVAKAICSGFENPPAECEADFKTDNPIPGFDDQSSPSAAASGAATTDASC